MAHFTHDTLQAEYPPLPQGDIGEEDTLWEVPTLPTLPALPPPEPQIQIHQLDVDLDIFPTLKSLANRQGGARYLMLGRPGSGKSVLIKDLLYYKRNFLPVASVISTTEPMNKFYETIVPPLFIHDRPRPEIISDFMARQKKTILEVPYESTFGAFVMDDCAADGKLLRSEAMDDLMKNGRHANIFFIMANQYVLDMPSNSRSCFEGIFLLRNSVHMEREKIYKNFFSIVPTFKLFGELMDQCTDDYGCIFLDNTKTSNNWQDCVKFYKAEKREYFQLGAPA